MNLDVKSKMSYVPARVEIVDFSETDVILTSRGGESMSSGENNQDWENGGN